YFPLLVHHWHRKLRSGILFIWPATGDGLGLRVEAEGIRSVLVEVTKPRSLPPAKGVVRDWHGNWHVDSYHSYVDRGCEVTGSAAVGCKDGYAIAVLMFSGKLHCFFQSFCTHHGQERTEDFISVNRHVWRHTIEKCWSSKEALGERFAIKRSRGHVERAAIGKQLGTAALALFDVVFNAVLGILGDQRTVIRTGIQAVADVEAWDLL